ncbi:MAG: HK97 family phage prohead protease [Planctomycetaceae bacterium]
MSSEDKIRRLRIPASLATIESRMDGEAPVLIAGYAAVFYRAEDRSTEYPVDSEMVERIMPGCFDAFLESQLDCTCSPDHDDRQLLGRRSSGRLLISADDRGLRYSVPYDATDPDHQRVAAKIRRKDVTGSSLRFYALEERWMRDLDTGLIVRELIRADVMQLGPVTDPAYAGTTAELRSHDGGWQTIQNKKAAFMAAEQLGHEALMIELEQELESES